jgi:hypothetical protein
MPDDHSQCGSSQQYSADRNDRSLDFVYMEHLQ